jgi:hypothetical protein
MDMDMSGLLDGASNWVGERAGGLFGQSPPQPQAAPDNHPTDRDSYDFSYIEEGLGLPEGILYALMMAESDGDINALSSEGAQGPFQLMPDTARDHGANPFDLHQAALAAGNELQWQLRSWGGDVDKALASYNYGHGNARRHGGDLDRISRVQIADNNLPENSWKNMQDRSETQEHNDRVHRYLDENQSQPQAQPQAQPKQIARKPNNETGFNYQAPAYGTDEPQLVLRGATGEVTDEGGAGQGRKLYYNNLGGKSSEYSIGVYDPKINNGQLTHIPSIYGGRIRSEKYAIDQIIKNKGKDPETGRFITPGGNPEDRSKGITYSQSPIASKPNNETGFNYQAPAYGTALKPISGKRIPTKKARPDMRLRKSMPQSVPSSMFGLKLR